MKQELNLIGPLLQNFFGDFLYTQKRVSPQTVASYRDTFVLLLQFVHKKYGFAPAAMRMADLDVSVILSFLDHLEQERRNSIRSRNARLAAIRSFFRMVPYASQRMSINAPVFWQFLSSALIAGL